jgi:hypothetical protein
MPKQKFGALFETVRVTVNENLDDEDTLNTVTNTYEPGQHTSRQQLLLDLHSDLATTPSVGLQISVSPSHVRSPSPGLSPKVLALLEEETKPPEGWSRARMYVHQHFPPTPHKKKIMKQLFDIETPDDIEKMPPFSPTFPSLNPVLANLKKQKMEKMEAERVKNAVYQQRDIRQKVCV